VGARLDKKHQRADWAQRPLPPEMLQYATEDTRYLPALRDVLKAELEQRGRMHWAEEEFALRETTRWPPANDGDAYLRLKNTRDLGPRQMAALRELYDWREAVASRRDVAAFRVVGNDVLVNIARALARDARQVARVDGVAASVADRYGAELGAAVQRALALAERELPQRRRPPRRPPPDPDFDARVEQLKRVRDAAAATLGLERGFLMPRQQLEAIARLRPRTREELMEVEDMRRWQVEALGDRLLQAIRSA
jgi:ribonuclease D